ncbi:MAG: XkdF-like putative serine protease domain-containing protein [Flavobacterium nitrogenifigens]|uniref:XkdF-like putative serine protease domain-containing protein n=1 Tax=Flavobacterium nitrogenifigens TaxID=1617283 RepID=UPI002808844B|nr:XkdF-like putative serine protease domain-containing protein [Flavobacterium nitrogenifigens]MDQ8012940.1 XkdF-like putative serine protease domain-containing protein [Flavobacterium nitrogenifigens]
MKKYELVFSKDQQGVFRVSLVKDPALETTLLHFNAEKPQIFHFTQDEKQIVYAPAMIPNKLIFRADVNGENAQVFYTSDTIDQLQKNYFKNGHNSTTNINHQAEDTTGIYPFESWIVQDPANDKSNAMGFDVPAGTWMMGYKIDNDQVWNDIKSGNLDGLSIEARLGFKEVNNNENYNKQTMNKKSIFKSIKDFFMANEDKKEFTSGDKKVYAIDLKEGEILTDEAGEPIANAEVEIDSKLYKTDDLGTITAIEDKPAEEEKATEEMAEETQADVPAEAEAPAEPADESQDDLEAENEQLKKDLATAQEELAKLQAEKIKADTELTEMKAQTPAAEAIKNVPPAFTKSYDEMSNYEKMQHNKAK